jgi:hypothetical protein
MSSNSSKSRSDIRMFVACNCSNTLAIASMSMILCFVKNSIITTVSMWRGNICGLVHTSVRMRRYAREFYIGSSRRIRV